MSTTCKYLYKTAPQSKSQYSFIDPELIKSDRYVFIELPENIDYCPHYSVSVSKLKQNKFTHPKNSEFETYKPILKEVFTDYYSAGLRNIAKSNTVDGEFYILSHARDWFELQYYSTDEKNKESIVIDFRDSIEELWLMVTESNKIRGRAKARKEGILITQEEFNKGLNLTLKYLSDYDSLKHSRA